MWILLKDGDSVKPNDEVLHHSFSRHVFWEIISETEEGSKWDWNGEKQFTYDHRDGFVVRRELQTSTTIEEVNSWTEEQHNLVRRADTPKGIIINQFEMLMNGENTVDEFIQTITEFNNTWKQLGVK